jgi:hypothetical protein
VFRDKNEALLRSSDEDRTAELIWRQGVIFDTL